MSQLRKCASGAGDITTCLIANDRLSRGLVAKCDIGDQYGISHVVQQPSIHPLTVAKSHAGQNQHLAVRSCRIKDPKLSITVNSEITLSGACNREVVTDCRKRTCERDSPAQAGCERNHVITSGQICCSNRFSKSSNCPVVSQRCHLDRCCSDRTLRTNRHNCNNACSH